MLLGVAATILMIVNGRTAGISGIVGQLLNGSKWVEDAAFVLGLCLGPLAYAIVFGTFPNVQIASSGALVALAGLLVGFGTRMGSGCTSGHGIVGLARLSPRSIAATAAFLAAGVATATLMGALR
ncbi:MAG: YeeE/YedE family protein [Rhizobiaceae bacterium]|nr:YeeE/YedE family protein [Rhizobiaceae bacterium]